MSITLLALAALLNMEVKPELLEPFTTMDACVAAANKRNLTEEGLRTPEARARWV